MSPHPSAGLSKAAADRRRNHQIPRKRPTQVPLRKPLVIHAKTKAPISPAKRGPGRPPKPFFQILHPHERGQDRDLPTSVTTTAATAAHGNHTRMNVRRILASRRNPNDPSVVEYKVQWETSWLHAASVRGAALDEWREAQDGHETFKYISDGGNPWTVLQDAHKSENDSEESQWTMWLAIRRNLINETDGLCVDGLADTDFAFSKINHQLGAFYPSDERTCWQPRSALSALQTAVEYIKQTPSTHLVDVPYGHVRIYYCGQFDESVHDNMICQSVLHRPNLTIGAIAQLIASSPFKSLEEQVFNHKRGAFDGYQHWRKTVLQLVKQAVFLFRTGTWAQLFAFLLLGSETFKAALCEAGMEIQGDWCDRAREYNLQKYAERIADNRPPHDIQETFLNLREFFRELKPDTDPETQRPGWRMNKQIGSSMPGSGISKKGVRSKAEPAKSDILDAKRQLEVESSGTGTHIKEELNSGDELRGWSDKERSSCIMPVR